MMYHLGNNRFPQGLDAEHATHAKQDLVPVVHGCPRGAMGELRNKMLDFNGKIICKSAMFNGYGLHELMNQDEITKG